MRRDRRIAPAAGPGGRPPILDRRPRPTTGSARTRNPETAPSMSDPTPTRRPPLPEPSADPRALRIPGPTPVPPAVMAAMQRPMIPHRGPSFKALYRDLLRLARLAHRTDGDVFTWPASGSAGW